MAEPARQGFGGLPPDDEEALSRRGQFQSVQGGGEGGEAPLGRNLSAVPTAPETAGGEPGGLHPESGRPNLRLIQGGKSDSGGGSSSGGASGAGAAGSPLNHPPAPPPREAPLLNKLDKGNRTGGSGSAIGAALQTAGAFVGRNKGKFGLGGGIAAIIVALVASFIALLPLKIVSMLESIFDKRVGQYAERDIGSRVDKIAEKYGIRTIQAGAEGDPAADARFASLIVADGQLEKDAFKTMRVNKFADQLAKDQDMRFQRGSKFGTVDVCKADGSECVNLGSSAARAVMGAAVRAQTKWYQFYKRIHMREWMRNALGIQRWKFFNGKEAPDDATGEVRGGLVDAAAAEDAIQLPKVFNDALSGDSSDSQSDSQVTEGLDSANQAGADAVKAASPKLTTLALQKIFGDAVAKQIATTFAKISGPLLAFSLVDIASRIDHFFYGGGADKVMAGVHKVEYEAQFAQWLVIKDQMKDGTAPNGAKLTGAEVNAVMQQTGDPANSCGFQQINYGKVQPNCQGVTSTNDGTNNAIGRSLDPNGQVIADGYKQFLDSFPGIPTAIHFVLAGWYVSGRHVMDVVNSVVGAILSAAWNLIENIVPGLRWLVDHIATLLVKLFTLLLSTAVSGVETNGDLFNNLDAGGTATGQDFLGSLGAPPITVAQEGAITQQIADQQAAANSKLSLATQLFSPDYDRSLVNQVAMIMPSSVTDAAHQTTSYMATMFANPMKWVGSILASLPIPGLQIASADGPAVDLYHPQHYDFSNAQLDSPIDDQDLATAAQNAATRLGKPLDQITLDDVTLGDCPDNGSTCKLDLVSFQSLYASQTTTDNGGIGDGTAGTSP